MSSLGSRCVVARVVRSASFLVCTCVPTALGQMRRGGKGIRDFGMPLGPCMFRALSTHSRELPSSHITSSTCGRRRGACHWQLCCASFTDSDVGHQRKPALGRSIWDPSPPLGGPVQENKKNKDGWCIGWWHWCIKTRKHELQVDCCGVLLPRANAIGRSHPLSNGWACEAVVILKEAGVFVLEVSVEIKCFCA